MHGIRMMRPSGHRFVGGPGYYDANGYYMVGTVQHAQHCAMYYQEQAHKGQKLMRFSVYYGASDLTDSLRVTRAAHDSRAARCYAEWSYYEE